MTIRLGHERCGIGGVEGKEKRETRQGSLSGSCKCEVGEAASVSSMVKSLL